MSITHRLDNWFLGHERSLYGRQTLAGGAIHNFKPGTGLTNLKAAALKKPEVMVKIPKRTGKATGLKAAANHIDYISRNGKLAVENQDGEQIKGKAALRESVIKEWQRQGIPEQSMYKESLNVVLSMPPGTDPRAVMNAAREFAQEVFKGHQYVFVQHLDEKHPHVHICVTMRNEMGKRMNPRKNDLFKWRVLFAEKMREHGVDCAATRRQHRGVIQKGVNGTVRHITKRGGYSTVRQKEVNELLEAIKTQKRPANPYLKEQLETRGLISGEYRFLAKRLYDEGLKVEARMVSELAKGLEQADVRTKGQEKFDKYQVKQSLEPASLNLG